MRLFGKNFRGKKNKSKKGCPHYFGYLKNRQKVDTTSDECLICSRLLECSTIQEGRNEIIKMMRVDVGFDFKEEELPPEMRREITKLVQEFDQIQYLRDLGEKARQDADRNKVIFYTFIIGGFLSLLVAIVSIYLTLISVLLFSVGYYFNGLSLREKKKAIDHKFQGDSKWKEVVQETTSLSKKAYKELTVLYEARVRRERRNRNRSIEHKVLL